jgi:hypothetical protein
MDHLTDLSGRNLAGKMREAAANAGIIPGEPMAAFVDVMAEAAAAIQQCVADLAHVTQADVNRTVASKAVEELPWAIDRLAFRQYRRDWMLVGGALILALVIGVALGWIWHASLALEPEALPGFTCQDQPDGSRLCYEYVRPAAKTQH